MGFYILHSSIGLGSKKCATVETYLMPCYGDLLGFEFCHVFFRLVKHSKIFVISVEDYIDALKLALGERIALEAKW